MKGSVPRSVQLLGVRKVHWECHSDCNLSCEFCYRSVSPPLNTSCAKRLISILASSGVRRLVFCGGDPLVRNDLAELIDYSKEKNLEVEIHTNAHRKRPDTHQIIEMADEFGLSIDGASASLHDAIRSKPGNFARVLEFVDFLEQSRKSYAIRTMVCQKNLHNLRDIFELISGLKFLRRWSLMQFTPAGEGFLNRDLFEISSEDFHAACEAIGAIHSEFSLDIYPNEAKIGTYVQIRSDGMVYTTNSRGTEEALYRLIGNALTEDLYSMIDHSNFSAENHSRRYGEHTKGS